jgi:isoleucyl-tRNA synthetase
VQNQRKELGCEYTDRIRLGVFTDDAALRSAVLAQADYIRGETLAVEERVGPQAQAPAGALSTEIDGHVVALNVEVVGS